MLNPTPQTTYLKDYAPPPYLIHTVELDIDIMPDDAIVTAMLTVARNPEAGDARAPLVLDGQRDEGHEEQRDEQPPQDVVEIDVAGEGDTRDLARVVTPGAVVQSHGPDQAPVGSDRHRRTHDGPPAPPEDPEELPAQTEQDQGRHAEEQRVPHVAPSPEHG